MVLAQVVLLPRQNQNLPPLFGTINHNFVGKRVRIRLLHVIGLKSRALVQPIIPLALDFISIATDENFANPYFSSSSPFRPDVTPCLINTPNLRPQIDVAGTIYPINVLSAPANGRVFLPNTANAGDKLDYIPPLPIEYTGVLLSPVLTVSLNYASNSPASFDGWPTIDQNNVVISTSDFTAWSNLIVTYDISEI